MNNNYNISKLYLVGSCSSTFFISYSTQQLGPLFWVWHLQSHVLLSGETPAKFERQKDLEFLLWQVVTVQICRTCLKESIHFILIWERHLEITIHQNLHGYVKTLSRKKHLQLRSAEKIAVNTKNPLIFTWTPASRIRYVDIMSYVDHFREAGKWHFRQKNDRPGSEISGYHKRVIDHPANSPPVSHRNQEGKGMNGILPRKLAYPMDNYAWKIMFFLKWSIFRGHVWFSGV